MRAVTDADDNTGHHSTTIRATYPQLVQDDTKKTSPLASVSQNLLIRV